MANDARQFGDEARVLLLVGVVSTAFFALALYPALGLPTPAPYPGRTLLLVAALAVMLRRNGESMRDLGLRRPPSLLVAAGITVALFAVKLFVVPPVADLVSSVLGVPPADRSFFDHLNGNEVALVIWLVLAWSAAAFGEELLFRGWLMTRLAGVSGGGGRGWTIALVGQAVLFGVGHFYVGPAGGINAAFGALVFGAFFLLAGRNLWPVILVHGAWDTLGIVLLYARGTTTI